MVLLKIHHNLFKLSTVIFVFFSYKAVSATRRDSWIYGCQNIVLRRLCVYLMCWIFRISMDHEDVGMLIGHNFQSELFWLHKLTTTCVPMNILQNPRVTLLSCVQSCVFWLCGARRFCQAVLVEMIWDWEQGDSHGLPVMAYMLIHIGNVGICE